MKWLKNNLNWCTSICLMLMTLTVFGPLELYLTNSTEFWFPLGEMLKISGILTATFGAVFFLIGLILRGKARSCYSAIVFTAAFCLYIQGNFLNVDYGVLDGRTIDWSSYTSHAVINTTCWLVCIAAFFFFWKKKTVIFERVATLLALFIITIQALTLGVLFINQQSTSENKDINITVDHMMEIGSDDNIVIFVLDSFEDALLDSFMETDGDHYHSVFSDFTRFTDCAGSGATTAAAMPILISGEYYPGGISYGEYVNSTFNTNHLYDELAQQGYNVSIYTEHLYLGNSAVDYVANLKRGVGQPSSYLGLSAKYGSFTFFKYMPHVLKQYFWLYTAEFDMYQSGENYFLDDAAFYNQLVTEGLRVEGEKAFRLIHLQGPHYPYMINEFAQSMENPTREQHAMGDLYIVEEYIKQMKACGVYDDAMIIITADHGDAGYFSSPILLVKNRGTTGVYAENDAPVSHIDLHPTLFSYLGQDKGNTFFDISESAPRERMFYLKLQEGGSFYMEEYIIKDKVSLVGLGTPTGRCPAPTLEMRPVTMNERMVLGPDGYGNQFIVSGVDIWPIDSVVSSGIESHFAFVFEDTFEDDLQVEIDVLKKYHKDADQSVQIFANGQFVHEEDILGPQTIAFTVPVEILNGETLELKLVYETEYCPLFYSGVTITSPEWMPTEEDPGFSLTKIIAIPLIVLMEKCYEVLGDYILAIIVFTLLSKIILMPVALWMQRSSITMVEMMPELNRIKTKYFGDKETISEETQILYKKRKYNPLASTVPMIVQIVLLMGVIEAVKVLLGESDSWLLWVPAEVGGLSLLMPVAAGFAALLLTLAQNKLAPLQKEQPKAEQLSTGLVSVGISLFLGAFVSLGTGVYWIASNLISIPVQVVCNWIINPKKYVDYEDLEASKKQLEQFEAVGKKKKESYFSENKKKERADYKRFFSVVNKHLVFYSESNGFYKYYKGFIEFILAHTNLTIHYITSDPNDQIFELEKTQPKIRGYYIGENKLITLMMKMDADVVVMTMPDLENYHIKRSYIRDDIEYVNVPHGMGSNNLTLRKGALDHFDTIFCAGIHQKIENHQTEAVNNLPAKSCVEVGYPLLDEMRENYAFKNNIRKKILIAPSWQKDNIIDSCLEELLDALKNTDYEIIVRPHPQEVRLKKEYMESLKAKYEPDGIEIQTDFTSNNPVMEADLLITDWSDISWEYAFTTLRPVLYINTPMKVMNPEWQKIEYPPLNIFLRDQLGKSLDVDQLDKAAETAQYLLANTEVYREKINELAHEYVYNLGTSAEAGATYLIKAVLRQIPKKGTKKNEG